MKKLNFAVVAAALLTASAPALAQQYHYNYGDSRVVNQNQTGLYMPSSTYIGAGTLSRSAQGKAAGVGAGLPAVNMGSHVRTPGDNIYDGDGSDRQNNGALIYKDQEQAILHEQRLKYIRQQQALMRRQKAAQPPSGYLYIPGSNGGTATYGSAPAQPQLQFRNGVATYGDSGKSGTRQF